MANRLKRYQAILFDLDGTLVDSLEVDNRAFECAMLECTGQHFPAHGLKPYIGMPAPAIFAELVPAEAVDAVHAVWLRYKVDFEEKLVLYPGIRAALERLHAAGLKLAVVTSQTIPEVTHIRTLLGLDDLISAWVTSDLVTAHKPDPAQVNYALRALGVDASRAVMVGDTFRDMEAGRNAGTAIGAALWGWSAPEKLLAYRPEYAFERAAELEKLLTTDF